MNCGERVRAIKIVIPTRLPKGERPLTRFQLQVLYAMRATPLSRYVKGWVTTGGLVVNFSTVKMLEDRGLLTINTSAGSASITDKALGVIA